jgi:hypothetical protein
MRAEMYTQLPVKCSLLLSDLNQNWSGSTNLRKVLKHKFKTVSQLNAQYWAVCFELVAHTAGNEQHKDLLHQFPRQSVQGFSSCSMRTDGKTRKRSHRNFPNRNCAFPEHPLRITSPSNTECHYCRFYLTSSRVHSRVIIDRKKLKNTTFRYLQVHNVRMFSESVYCGRQHDPTKHTNCGVLIRPFYILNKNTSSKQQRQEKNAT